MGNSKKKTNQKDADALQIDGLLPAKYHTTPAGLKLIYNSAKMIQERKLETAELTFSTKEFFSILESKSAGKYDKVKKTCKDLIKSYLSLKTQNGWKISPIFSNIEFEESKDEVIVRFHHSLRENLLYLRKNINSEEALNSIMEFKSKYSMKIYEICKESLSDKENNGEKTMEISELRAILGVEEDEYLKYNDFKRRVMLKAQKEINAGSEICLDFEEEKQDRRVAAVKFIVKYKAEDDADAAATEAV